ncbi:MAG: flavodoxin domain-containing protein [Buchananella hordeovulneris]|nr:flavodoxin domain-containing protein [Buchananella hordeovulneris]
MRILIAVASKHGSTDGVGDEIARVLGEAGHDVVRTQPEFVENLAGYDAVVLGSAVYMTHWMDSARQFIRRFSADLRRLPVFTFSVGMNGVINGKAADPSRIGPVLISLEPRDNITFSGRIDSSQLSLRERSIARLGGAIEGDYRNWDLVRQWAQKVAAELEKSGS